MDNPLELKILSCHLGIAKAKFGQGPFGVERTLLQFCGILVLGFFSAIVDILISEINCIIYILSGLYLFTILSCSMSHCCKLT